MAYRLIYWAKRGRGEQIRLLLAELGQEYIDVHVSPGQEVAELRAQGPSVLPFGSVPVLEDGELRLAQGPVILSYLARKHGIAPTDLALAAKADSIAWAAEDLRMKYFGLFGSESARKQAEFVNGPWTERWLPTLSGLLELDGDRGFFVGGALGHADIAVWDVLDSCTCWVEGARLDRFPRLVQFFEAMKARPRIAAYLASPRRAAG